MPLFKEGKHVTVMKKLINLWPSIKHKNKLNIKIILHYHYKKIKINVNKRNLKTSKNSILENYLASCLEILTI